MKDRKTIRDNLNIYIDNYEYFEEKIKQADENTPQRLLEIYHIGLHECGVAIELLEWVLYGEETH